MKNIILICLSLISFALFSQIQEVELCGTHKILAEFEKDAKFKQKFEQNKLLIQNVIQELKNKPQTRGEVYTIPVVFHVLHNGGAENISKEQIENALFILNRDYRKLNNDANTVNQAFQSIVADVEVEFKLATKAPNGVCFGGITRTQSPLSQSNDGWGQVGAIIQGNDVFQGQWPGNQYLNIFVCDEIGNGAAGYTYLPGSIGNSMYNGIWVLDEYVGSIGTSEVGRSRVLTHEVGHWLGLPHTWGYTNNPGLMSNCDSDDDIDDTPNTIGTQWCNQNEASCGVLANVENYMDYSYCSKMFTEGQKEYMRAILNSTIDGRNNLITTQNLIATGANEEMYLCRAFFNSNKKDICLGESVAFFDASYNKSTTWSWYFEGGTPQISTLKNPTITYTTEGEFDVKLVVSDGEFTDSILMTNYVKVLPQAGSLPFYEGFETYTNLTNNPIWKVINPQNNQTFQIRDGVANSGTKCVFISNYSQSGSNIDELVSSQIDLSSITENVTLSFRYSYRKRPTVNSEKLQVYTSSDCGLTWNLRRTLSGTLLSDGESTVTWVPSVYNDWRTSHVTNILSNAWTENFMFKFRFMGERGNNIYIDDINLYSGPPNDDLYIESQNSIDELNSKDKFDIYPNPNNGDFIISFNEDLHEEITIEIVNELGQNVFTKNKIMNSSYTNITNVNLTAGVYFIKVLKNNTFSTKKFIIN
jgi:PKD repeat protein